MPSWGRRALGWLCVPCYARVRSMNLRVLPSVSALTLRNDTFQPRATKQAALRGCSSNVEVSRQPIAKVESDDGPRPLVVLVHGFLGHRVQFLPIATSLSRKKFDVLNFGYASRTETLQEHAKSLVDAVSYRVKTKEGTSHPTAVHYVTHSFGGVVLRAALRSGQLPVKDTRVVFVAPPIQGCILARMIYEADMGDALRPLSPYVQYAAEAVLGTASGHQLMKHSSKWFFNEQDHGPFPGNALVIAGNLGLRLNPLIPGDNDGVVAVSTSQVRSNTS
jgi:pimeloyl-ACP methyl ester carboxylesterase